jgi:hypothetical protein
MVPGLPSFVRLLADQAVAASTALVDLGTGASLFSFSLPATKQCVVEIVLPFSVGATGGFKFQLTSSQTLVDYSMNWEAIDGVTASPGAQVALVNVAQNPFANAWAVAGNHTCKADGSLKGHATLASTVTLQFACNSAANSISVLKGAFMRVTFIN